MKITSTCEREFVEKCISSKEPKRLDGRLLKQGRTLKITFGQEWGCCIASLGNTRVLSQVTADITEPKAVSPTEGALHINLELSSMAAPDINTTRGSSDVVELQRSLERCVRDSKCIDLESLCILAGLKVWTIKVNLHPLNDDGNLLECASIAAIASLAHFKRPDVTVVGTDITLHTLDDREPVPLNLHHMPICINLAIFGQGTHILIDPTEIEERIADGCYVIGMNSHQEICFVHRRGVLLLKEETIEECESIAVSRAQTVTQDIRSAIDDDSYNRATKAPVGFVNMLQTSTILGATQPIYNFDINCIKAADHKAEENCDAIEVSDAEDERVLQTQAIPVSTAKERAMEILKSDDKSTVFEGGRSKWGAEEDTDSSEEEEDNVNKSSEVVMKSEFSEEEEEEAFLDSDQVDIKPSSSTRGWYSKNPFSYVL